jgi:signal transduction histidine kinase
MLYNQRALKKGNSLHFVYDAFNAIINGGTKNLRGAYKQQLIALNSMLLTAFLICIIRFAYILFFVDFKSEVDGYLLWNASPLILLVICFGLIYKLQFTLLYYIGLLGFPVLLFLFTFFVHDKGIVAFQICFLIYPFYFLNNFKKIIACFLLALFMSIFGYYNQYQSHEHHNHSSSTDFLKYITYAGAVCFAFINLLAMKIQIWAYQKGIKNKRKQLEDSYELISQQKEEIQNDLSVRNKILSVISHDLRVPLFGLRIMIDTINKNQTPELLKEAIPDVTQEIDKVILVYSNLLYWAKLQLENTQVSFDVVDISEAVTRSINIVNNISDEKKVTIINKVTKDTFAYTDGQIAEIVIRNIISNAVKFTPSGQSVYVSSFKHDNMLVIEIKDEGIGISDLEMKKIHNSEFYTTKGTNKEPGTGIGLMVCKELAEKLEGEIMIKSSKGEGTVVSLFLPR